MIVLPGVYPPSEDTFLLLDCLPEKLSGKRFLDMGCGTGIIGLEAAKRGAEVTCTDISPIAVYNTYVNFREAGLDAKIVRSDLFQKVSGAFDFVFFNPPYLPCTDDPRWSGGKEGNEVIIRFLRELPEHLAGEAYIIISSLSNPERVYTVLESLNLSWDVQKEKRMFFERLEVIRICR